MLLILTHFAFLFRFVFFNLRAFTMYVRCMFNLSFLCCERLLYGPLNNTGAFVGCHNVGSVMTFRSDLNVTLPVLLKC